MKYFYSTFHEKKVRIDEATETCYVRDNGKEVEVPHTTKLITDTILEGNEISEEEYGK